jgi:enamine deaminase RidA (YjgF/YER057c/UK114 family)
MKSLARRIYRRIRPRKEEPNPEPITYIEPGPQASQVVIHNGIAEVVGVIHGDGSKSAYEQTKAILERIDDLLAQAGTDKSKLLRGWLIATTHKHRDDADRAWMEWLEGLKTPARVSMVAGLGSPAFKVEITITAAIAHSRNVISMPSSDRQ